MEITVVYQDEYLLVVDKPVGLSVHKNDFMSHDAPYLTKLLGAQTGKWIFNVHRLDSKTSGLMVLAFSAEIAHELTLQFERKEVEKEYIAIVLGELTREGIFDEKVLVRKKGSFRKDAVTRFSLEKVVQTTLSFKEHTNVCLSQVRVMPETGRWHQIRQHFAKNRHDIIGDTHHGNFALNKLIRDHCGFSRLMLHAGKLIFRHPVSGETLGFETALPPEFEQLMQAVAAKQ